MKIYFLRHGEADYELEKVPGEFPGVPLTQNGIMQSKMACQELQDIHFDFVFCSDMRRTKETIAPLLKFLKQVPIYDSRIREVGGPLNGDFKDNWFEEPIEKQKSRLDSFIKELKNLDGILLIVCHFGVIQYVSSMLGHKIIAPQPGSVHAIEV